MRRGLSAAELMVIGGLMACSASGGAVVETAGAYRTLTVVERAVVLSLALRVQPQATDSILSAYGVSRAGFDSLMYAVAIDPELARIYAAAAP
ncbi:MAG: hypothetical protein WD934_08955 [Gemmatimonadales bacterium]